MRSSHTRHTLATLAQDLGVSRATVSNAYNHPDQLSRELQARILARAAELSYPGPDPAGRLLRGARIGAVGVLVDQSLSYAFADPAASLLLDGLASELQVEGFGLLVHAGLVDHNEDLRHLRDAAVDAWVVLSLPDESRAIEAIEARGRPLVVLDQPALDGVARIGITDRLGCELATQHLLSLEHRDVGVLTMALQPDGGSGPASQDRQDACRYHVMRERLAGVRGALESAGIEWGNVPVLECASNDPDAGAKATSELLAAHPELTAIIALSDQLALGALRAAHELGVAVPDRLSVVGFDDAPPAAHSYPPLTTIAQPIHEKGRAAGRQVRALLSGEVVCAPEPYPVELVIRGSTGPVAR